MVDLSLSVLPIEHGAPEVEIVERKGVGHPDSICDALSETFSAALCRAYRLRFGTVYHHNVDKALLRAGRARPAFRGGEVLEPMEITVAGRATTEVRGERIPVEEIFTRCATDWLNLHMHALDPKAHVKLVAAVRPGSSELVGLWERAHQTGVSLSNDTSFGTGFAPFSPLERAVLAVSSALEALAADPLSADIGEDTKVMGVRRGGNIRLLVACAFVGRFLKDLDHYQERKRFLAAHLAEVAHEAIGREVEVVVNASDDPPRGEVFLTVTGTSGEAGDDGQVGRGNRYNGLITPYRPMSLEAISGKNPITHTGKLYGILSHRIAHAIVDRVPEVAEATCTMLSRIGRPVRDPELVEVRVRPHAPITAAELRPAISRVIDDELARDATS